MRQPGGILRGLKQKFFLLAEFARFAVGDKCVGNISKRALNCLLIKEQRCLLLRFCQADIRTDPARGENRLREGSSKIPCARRSIEQTGERRRLQACTSTKGDLRK